MSGPPGGDILPTPNSELAKVFVETGGLSMKSILQKSNPLKNVGCDEADCLPCKPGKGGGG